MTKSYTRAILTFHHILSTQKKKTIQGQARNHRLRGICKVGKPGVLAVEGRKEPVDTYLRQIKSLRWASCTLTNYTADLEKRDLRMAGVEDLESEDRNPTGVVMVKKMTEIGAYLRRVGLEDWWRESMGYSKSGSE